MPVKQRQRLKRRTFAKLRIQRQQEQSEDIECNTDTIDGDPIFTENDIEDTRIAKLLQQRQNSNIDDADERDIFLTDLLDADSDDDDVAVQNDDDADPKNEKNKTKTKNDVADDEAHEQMLEEIFGSQPIKEATIMGSQLDADPLDIETNANDLQYLLTRHHRRNHEMHNLSRDLDELHDADQQHQQVTMAHMMQNLNNAEVPIAHAVKRQINEFDDAQQIQKLKLTAQTKITPLNLERKERGLQMDRTRHEMQQWSQSVAIQNEKLSQRRNLIPPANNLSSFMQSMEWHGDFGVELQRVLDDYSATHDLDDALAAHAPSTQEVRKQAGKMAAMRRQIGTQIREFKRIKKIKSKAFRRRVRARKSKVAPSLDELHEIDPKLYKREVAKLLRERAEERLTLRHKNTTSWAKHILRRSRDGKIDVGSRKALMEQIERGRALRRKIKGLDSDDDDDDDDKQVPGTLPEQSENVSFETEAVEEQQRREQHVKDASEKGIWNMQFMSSATHKRRSQISALTESAEHATSMAQLDSLQRKVEFVQRGEDGDAMGVARRGAQAATGDDPVATVKHARWLRRQQHNKQVQHVRSQTILGKRKFGFTAVTKDVEEQRVAAKKLKRNVLDVAGVGGNRLQLVEGTQQIEESVFGARSKSVVSGVEVGGSGGDQADVLQQKVLHEGVFEMVQFPRHDSRKTGISELNRCAEREPPTEEQVKAATVTADALRNAKVEHQRVYEHEDGDETTLKKTTTTTHEENAADDDDDDNDADGWSVVLSANQSVNDVFFGTLGPNGGKTVVLEKPETETPPSSLNIDIAAFVNNDDEDEDSDDTVTEHMCDRGQQQQTVAMTLVPAQVSATSAPAEVAGVKSILKRSQFEQASSPTSDEKRRVRWRKTLTSSQSQSHPQSHSQTPSENPWISNLKNKSSKRQPKQAQTATEQEEQAETTQFDPHKMLIPANARKTPDFNLLDTKDPTQLKLIYDTLQRRSSSSTSAELTTAEFMPTEDHEAQFAKLKGQVVAHAMPDTPNGPLMGWDSWTGYGVADDAAYRDQEYLRSKALWQKRKQRLMQNRHDGRLEHVILSDEISGKSRKYVLRHQPDWVNLRAYKEKMRDTLGREWNLSTEFHHAIQPDFDIPHGYIVTPTPKQDGTYEDDMQLKTMFGEGKEQPADVDADMLPSVYKGDVMVSQHAGRDFDARPEKFKI